MGFPLRGHPVTQRRDPAATAAAPDKTPGASGQGAERHARPQRKFGVVHVAGPRLALGALAPCGPGNGSYTEGKLQGG